MIVHDRPTGFQLFWILRGSVLYRIRLTLAVNVALAVAVTVLHGYVFNTKVVVTMAPFTLIGLPIAIFLGFRNNTAYARYWEARNLWGEIIYRARSLSRQCLGLIRVDGAIEPGAMERDVRVRMVRRAVAFAHALRLQLRGLQDDALLQRWITIADWERIRSSSNRADALMQSMGRDLGECVREGRIDPCLAASVDRNLTALAGTAAGCERIRHTPVPFSYTLLLHRTAYMYCFLLPFGLVDSVGFMTPFVVAIVAYTFFGLDALGDEIEEPFGLENNDLPLDMLCRTLEINLLESLGATDLPQPLTPHNYRLT